MEKLTECNCIDCGGTEPSHAANCEYMVTEFGLEERDLHEKPYTADEQRVVDYINLITDGAVGAGSDPIGFLLASHSYIQRERHNLITENGSLKADQETFYYLAKWVERGLFDHHHSAKEALEVIAHHPGMPWKEGRWDVDHKPYAKEFYKKFPKAKGEMEANNAAAST
jgi:hypothetical protein